MRFAFLAKADSERESKNPVPIVLIDREILRIVSFDLKFRTKTEEENSGTNMLFVEGYLPHESPPVLREYGINLITNTCAELTILNPIEVAHELEEIVGEHGEA